MALKREYDIVGNRKKFFTISISLMVIALLVSVIFGVKVDIQFKGGTITTYSYTGELNKSEAQGIIEKALGESVKVQETTNASGENSLVVSLTATKGISVDEQSDMTLQLQEKFPDNSIELAQTSSVDPAMGNEFFLKCLVAVVFAFIILIIYIALRFKKISGWSAGVMSVIALFHDVIMVYATFVIFRIPLNDNFMAVVLTILGYSINDTIIIYDRIRENKKIGDKHLPVAELVNKSINQTLARSINTSVTTILVMTVVCVVALIFGITSIVSFALPLIIGMISGVYSTICIAGPLWVMWQEHKEKKKVLHRADHKEHK